jgi:hypothetical protein
VPVPALALLDIRTLLVIGDVSMPPSRRTANRDLLQRLEEARGVVPKVGWRLHDMSMVPVRSVD